MLSNTEHFKLSASKEFPAINFNHKNGKLRISGKSFMEDAVSFYNPVIDWLKKYCKNPASKTTLTVTLEYMNTSSSKFILDIFDLLNQSNQQGKDVLIIWQFQQDDEDRADNMKTFSIYLSSLPPFKNNRNNNL